MGKVELLAPAGNYESFLGAIHAGADAVYIGGQKYGARAYAENFTQEEVCLAIRYAHLFERKVYLTVNTLVKEAEMEELPSYIRPFYLEGLDGAIVQDFGVFSVLKQEFPGLALHGSTQMTVTGERGARFLLEQGASRVVPARELSLEELRKIKETGIEVEAFVHGAMCYCYSGQCLFSSMLGGRSGNRGRCAQPCRLPYEIRKRNKNGEEKTVFPNAGKEGYPLSLKDLCTLELLPELIEAGIDSFKIEGRMKRPEYAAGVTALYRKYMDRYFENPAKEYRVEPKDLKRLRSLYIRSGIQEGYYHRHNGREMITPDKPGYRGADESYLQEIRESYLERSPVLSVDGRLLLKKGAPSRLTLSCRGVCFQAFGAAAEQARKQSLTGDAVRKQIGRMGNTAFFLRKLELVMDGDAFLPIKALNDLRRRALEGLTERLLSIGRYGRAETKRPEGAGRAKPEDTEGLALESLEKRENRPYTAAWVRKKEQLEELLLWEEIDRIYLPELPACEKQTLADWKAAKSGRQLWFVMPAVLRLRDEPWLNRRGELLKTEAAGLFDGLLIRNLESLVWAREIDWNGQLLADSNFYVWNRRAKQFWRELGVRVCAPLECNNKEWKKLGLAGMEVTVYGRSALMVTANCVRKTCGACQKGREDESWYLKDRYHALFPVECVCAHCYNEIYNSVPLSLHEYPELAAKGQAAGIRLCFTMENAEEMRRVRERFLDHTAGPDRVKAISYAYTRGHLKRGAE